jgi:hypothetical protein
VADKKLLWLGIKRAIGVLVNALDTFFGTDK